MVRIVCVQWNHRSRCLAHRLKRILKNDENVSNVWVRGQIYHKVLYDMVMIHELVCQHLGIRYFL